MRPTAHRRNARDLCDRQAFEHVRIQAGALLAAGHSQAQVARQLGVARQNVSRWYARWRSGGLDALRSAGPTGTTPRLSDVQLAAIDQALRAGARAQGFDTDHWTLARITAVIERLTGVGYHRGHVWKLLRHRIGWRLQRPARRAIERNEQAIARWVAEDWPRGITPIIRHRFKWKRVSLAAGLCYGSRGGGAALAFHRHPEAYDTDSLIGALGELRRTLGGQKATLLWDGLPAHRSRRCGPGCGASETGWWWSRCPPTRPS